MEVIAGLNITGNFSSVLVSKLGRNLLAVGLQRIETLCAEYRILFHARRLSHRLYFNEESTAGSLSQQFTD